MGCVGRDWKTTDFVARFAATALKLRAIGRIETIQSGYDAVDAPVVAHARADVPAILSKHVWTQRGRVHFGAKGSHPHAWELVITYDPRAESVANLTLVFDDPMTDADPSPRLWAAFRKMARSEDCDEACLHPWSRLHADRGKRRPIVSGAGFDTVLWANFIGRSDMSRFERDELSLDAHTVESRKDGALLLRLCDSIRDLYDSKAAKPLEQRRMAMVRSFERAYRVRAPLGGTKLTSLVRKIPR